MRTVLDANVIIGALPSRGGTLLELRRYLVAGAFTLVTSDHILSEVAAAWREPYWAVRLSEAALDEAFALIRRVAEVVEPAVVPPGVAPHRQDDAVLGTVLPGEAQYLVTGDGELIGLRTFAGAQVVTAREFVDILNARTV